MSIRRNTLFNLAGTVIPTIVGLLTVPAYIHLIGQDRYGVLVMVWLLLGYFGFFDLGLARATSNFIAKMKDELPVNRQNVVWTSLGLNVFFGLAGGGVMYAFAAPLLIHVFKMPEALRSEVLMTLPWIALAIPVATISGVLTGALEGIERFAAVNLIQVVGSILLQIVPLLVVLVHGPGLEILIPVVILVRFVMVLPLFMSVANAIPLATEIRFDINLVKPLLGYGGWVALTFLIIPILETLDKFIIGGLLGASAVTYYTIPFNLVDRFRLIPRAFMRSLFPVFSKMDKEEAKELTIQSVGLLSTLLTPLTVGGIFLIGPFLTLWIGKDLSSHATILGEILLVGIWINSLAHIPFAYMEAIGRPDMLTKLQLFTLPFFLGILWLGAHWFGLEGIAMAWTLRVWLDANILFRVSGMLLRCWASIWIGALLVALSLVVVMFYPFVVLPGVLLIISSIGWAWLSEPKIRETLTNFRVIILSKIYLR